MLPAGAEPTEGPARGSREPVVHRDVGSSCEDLAEAAGGRDALCGEHHVADEGSHAELGAGSA